MSKTCRIPYQTTTKTENKFCTHNWLTWNPGNPLQIMIRELVQNDDGNWPYTLLPGHGKIPIFQLLVHLKCIQIVLHYHTHGIYFYIWSPDVVLQHFTLLNILISAERFDLGIEIHKLFHMRVIPLNNITHFFLDGVIVFLSHSNI